MREKEEAERAAAEAAASKGKKAPDKKAPGRTSVTSDPAAAEGEAEQAEIPEPEEPAFASLDDDPSKSFEFFEFKKIMSQIPSGQTTVGSMLGAMVLQISQKNDKTLQESLK